MMAQGRITQIFITTAMCISIASGTFIAERNSSLSHTYATVTARSAIECCQQCQHEAMCKSANFCPKEKTCELNDRSPVDFPYSEVMATPNKHLYYKKTDPCQHPWIPYLGHCYRLVKTTQFWQQSEENCNTMGAYLTDISDEFENTFVWQMADDAGMGEAWLGLGNYHTIKPQVWTSGRPLNYTNFYPGQPSSSVGGEECINLFSGGQWNDRSCNTFLPSVCKKRNY